MRAAAALLLLASLCGCNCHKSDRALVDALCREDGRSGHVPSVLPTPEPSPTPVDCDEHGQHHGCDEPK